MKLVFMEAILAIIGYGLLWRYANWKVALAVLVVIWANNIGRQKVSA